jgi:nucleotide-binding universal stress UspA family protein
MVANTHAGRISEFAQTTAVVSADRLGSGQSDVGWQAVSSPEWIIAGVDGSEGSRHALEFALREAQLRNASLRVVSVWHVPWSAYSGAPGLNVGRIITDLRQDADQELHRMVADVTAKSGDVDVVTDVREGQPAQVLVELSRDAALLVVGSRGLGGFRGLLLGSVSHQCAQHAVCPVAIVPPVRRD